MTALLAAWSKGDQSALSKVVPLVYAELHRIARRAWGQHPQNDTLQPTALINEAYLKLANAENATFHDRCHFFAVASTAMRQVLVNHAKSRLAEKRGGGRANVSLDETQPAIHQEAFEIVALHESLDALQALDPRKSRVVEMRYFGGLSIEETADQLCAKKSNPFWKPIPALSSWRHHPLTSRRICWRVSRVGLRQANASPITRSNR
ncbi:MAG TPA: ECF-type sigma factor [Candidatus Solibacter sp.]